jgi:uncharacterized protein YjbI with pentapeptide repeats
MKPTREELDNILKNHQLWLKTKGNQGAQAVLDGLDLSGRRLRYAQLERASCIGTNFTDCDLRYANLSGANCLKATFTRATMYFLSVKYGDFRYANFWDAKIGNAASTWRGLSLARTEGSNLANRFAFASDMAGIKPELPKYEDIENNVR